MNALAQSYRKAAAHIRHTGCVWVESHNGWYHTYHRGTVLARIKHLEALAESRDPTPQEATHGLETP